VRSTRPIRARRLGVTKRGARLAPRAIAVVEQVDAEFFADVPTTEALRILRRLVPRRAIVGAYSSTARESR
jgi:DNA-binding MarR family transcriptional regulator